MKKFYVFLFILFPLFTNAQSNNEITIGIGRSFFGWGDVTGTAMTATYSYSLSKHLDLEPRIIISTGWSYEDISYNSGANYTYGYHYGQTSYLAAAASFIYTPFNGWADFLKIKSGFLIGSMAHSSGSKRFGGYPYNSSDFGKELNLGLIHSVNFRIIDKQKIFMGTELSMLTSFYEGTYNCDGFVWNFMLGFKI